MIQEEFEKEWQNYFKDKGDVATINIKHLAMHFANWQKEETINKACEWLNENLPLEMYRNSLYISNGDFINDFRKSIKNLNEIIMDYEKLYKEALEKARECMKDGGISQNTIDYLCNIFPELAEPKFKVGDWCIDNEDGVIFQIVKVLDNTYTYKTNEGKEYSCTHYSLENDAKHWTIQDAKDGDVLAFDNNTIVIFKNLYSASSFHSYCHIEDGVFNISQHGIDDLWDAKGFHPATKEQRDILFSKMKDMGYEWDADEKEIN